MPVFIKITLIWLELISFEMVCSDLSFSYITLSFFHLRWNNISRIWFYGKLIYSEFTQIEDNRGYLPRKTLFHFKSLAYFQTAVHHGSGIRLSLRRCSVKIQKIIWDRTESQKLREDRICSSSQHLQFAAGLGELPEGKQTLRWRATDAWAGRGERCTVGLQQQIDVNVFTHCIVLDDISTPNNGTFITNYTGDPLLRWFHGFDRKRKAWKYHVTFPKK